MGRAAAGPVQVRPRATFQGGDGMIDMEKVIKGVEHCFHGQECCGDIECPYYIEHLSDSCCLEDCQENLKADVIALLKEQETQKECLMRKCVICPHCENCDVDENGLLKEQKTELCDRCGRVRLKSKWEGRLSE